MANKQEHQISFGMIQPSAPTLMRGNFINKDTGAYDMGELDEALYMYMGGQDHHSSVQDQQRQTLNIFPSQPMHVEPSTKVGLGLVPPSNSPKTLQEPTMELGHPRRIVPALPGPGKDVKAAMNKTGTKKGGTSSSEHEGPKTPDPKILRRLAQNREAARKSRLRRKAYVQQLETSRIKLTQLEQELQRARSQGVLLGGSIHGDQAIPGGIACISSESAMFDMEYGRWVEEHHRLMCELRAAVQEHLPENDLRMFVESCLSHYDELANLKSIAIKTDVFHLVSGLWKTPAERCFLWLGDFRPSEIIKISARPLHYPATQIHAALLLHHPNRL